jgi:hypothetical protein
MFDEDTGGTAMADQGDAAQEEVEELTNQFYVTLKACVDAQSSNPTALPSVQTTADPPKT